MLDIDHCPRCNQLFRKVTRDICPGCMNELDKMYESIYRFIRRRENREATIENISENLNIEKDDIIHIIRLGRLNLKSFPNLGYPCETETCDQLITEGRLCHKCISQIQNGLYAERRRKEKEAKKKELERQRYRTYETF